MTEPRIIDNELVPIGTAINCPVPTARARVVLEARRRRISTVLIAAALGVSHQAVVHILHRHGIKAGGSLRKSNIHVRQGHKMFTCKYCGKKEWRRTSDLKNNAGYCSVKCSGLDSRSMTEEQINKAIDMRLEGHSWNSLGKLFKVPYQTIQKRIWFYLYGCGLLKRNLVQSIWDPGISVFRHGGRWKWITNSTGIHPDATS